MVRPQVFIEHSIQSNYTFQASFDDTEMVITACRYVIEDGVKKYFMYQDHYAESLDEAYPEFTARFHVMGHATWNFNQIETDNSEQILDLSKAIIIAYKLADKYLLNKPRILNWNGERNTEITYDEEEL